MPKSLVIIINILLMLSPAISFGQSAIVPPNPSISMSNYKVDASAPFLSKAWLWILLGGAPSNFTLMEYTWSADKAEDFAIFLVDNGGHRWMELHSDTVEHSIVKLPDDTVKTMGADGITFIKELRKVFADSRQHYVTGKVTLGDVSLYASAAELASSAPHTRRFIVRTYDDQDTYIDGEVVVDYADCVIAYRQIDVFVTKSKVRLKLTNQEVKAK